jgi:hypothetical protein
MKNVASIFIIALLLCPAVLSASSRDDAAYYATRARLEKKTSIDFRETALPDVLEYLRRVADVNIVLDEEALFGRDARDIFVTLRLRNVRVRTILKFLTEKIDMRYAIIDGVIFISDHIEEPTYLRIYDVRDLLATVPDFGLAGTGVGEGAAAGTAGAGLETGRPGIGGGGGERAPGGAGGTDSVQAAAEELIALIKDVLDIE